MSQTVDVEAAAGLDDRDWRALTERMTVFAAAPGIFDVVGEGSTYRLDLDDGRCECPDSLHRDVECKHVRRVRFVIGAREVPEGIEPVGDWAVYEGDAR